MTDHLSPHFAVSEIFGGHTPTKVERFLARTLCMDLLEPIRRIIGHPLHVTDGYRTRTRIKELRQRGYNPYRYSDHSYLQSWHPWGVGAADIVKIEPTRGGHHSRVGFTEEEYDEIVSVMSDGDYTPWGQLIWYRRRRHIHVSNPREVMFSTEFIGAHRFPRRAATYIKEA